MEKLTEALNALATYDYGSSRAALLPIDQAANAVFGKPAEQARFEEQLLAVLPQARSTPARQYVCSILARIGTKKSLTALTGMLDDTAVSTSARAALEAIPSEDASKVLRKGLSNAKGANKAGIINSLGARRDASAVGALVDLAEDPDLGVADAAVAALGEIGTKKSGQALMKVAQAASKPVVRSLGDAMLTCAEHLRRNGDSAEAKRLLSVLSNTDQPQHVRDAAKRAT